jgi:hypothetical protein
MSNYPMGMSRADLIHVGEIEDPDVAPDWFGEQLKEEFVDRADDLWQEFNECDWSYPEDAKYWLEANYPELIWDAA